MYKRPFDLTVSFILVLLLGFFMLLICIIAGFDTQSNGVFSQRRVGQNAKIFHIYKFRTYHLKSCKVSTIGAFLRKYKLDELPQLFNVLLGQMSLVGPRPDVEGYYDQLKGKERLVLQLKPGITGLASLKYKNEEELLKLHENPKLFNDEVLFPDKVRLNLIYLERKNLGLDVLIMLETILPFGFITFE